MTPHTMKKVNLDYCEAVRPPRDPLRSGYLNMTASMVTDRWTICPMNAPKWHVHLTIGQPSSETRPEVYYTLCMAPGNALRLAEQLKSCGEQAYARLVMQALGN